MKGFLCATCGQYHEHLPLCFGAAAPALWFAIPEAEREARAELASEQCIIDGKYFFVLGRIVLPLLDGPATFVWLAWASLSPANFLRMSTLWDTPGREAEPPYFAWLQSALPGYEPSTLSLKACVRTMPVGERPLIELEPCDHPLSREQRDGITLARLRQIASAVLHVPLSLRERGA